MQNPDKLKNRQGRIWLNIASSCHLLDEFVNVDSNFLYFLVPFYPLLKPLLKPPAREWIEEFRSLRHQRKFVFANCGKPLPFPPNSVDHILASHFLEHLYRNDAATVIKSFHAILKPGGTAHFIVPDVEAQAREYVAKIGDPQAAERFVEALNYHYRPMPPLSKRILLATGMFDAGHHWMYDIHSLSALVQELGFEILPQNDTPSREWRRTDPQQVNLALRKK